MPGHHRDWLDCIKSGNKPCASFEAVGMMVQSFLTGAIAERVGGKLYWGANQMRFTNSSTANDLL